MVLGWAPKFDEGSHELTLIALGADVCQTDHKIVLEETLDDDVSIDSGEIEVDGQHVQHVQPFLLYEIVEDGA